MFFNRQSAYLLVQIVRLFSPTCSFIRMMQTSIRGFLRKTKNERKLARSFNSMFRYINDVISPSNSKFGNFVHRINPIELEIKDPSDTALSTSYLYLHLEIHSEDRLRPEFYDKRDDFNFRIVNFPFICIATFQQHRHMEYISLS